MRAHCAAGPEQLRSKSPVAWDRGAEFVIQRLERHRLHPFRRTPVANHFSMLPSSTIARHETARTVRSAAPREQRASQPHAGTRVKLPVPSASRQASVNKSDKAEAEFV